MVDRSVIFSAPMVRALLGGRKTMTRRLAWLHSEHEMEERGAPFGYPSRWQRVVPGDRLWVKETWADSDAGAIFRADPMFDAMKPGDFAWQWRPSIYMRRWASRLTLTVTETKIERLQDISKDDAKAEGARHFPDIPLDPAHRHFPQNADRWSMENPPTTGHCLWSARFAFANYWESLHGSGSWDANPEVVALRFTVDQRNVDAKEAA